MRFLKRLLCCIGIHWSGVSGQSSMHNLNRCDICSDGYVDGILIHDRNRRKN